MKSIVLILGILFAFVAKAEDYYWKSDNIYGGVIFSSKSALSSDCAARATETKPTRLVIFSETRIACWDTGNRYKSAYTRMGDGCSDGYYDNETLSCVSSNPCLNASPVSSHTQGQTACYNQCSYDSLGGFRDFNNALSPLIYEYVATGTSCSGDEEVDISSDASEYTETNEDDLSCRVDGAYQVCINADESCKLVNGVEICIDHETREDLYNCGTFNGEVLCFPKTTSSSCKLVAGEPLCVYPEGDKIDPDSVDHPNNGGNANRNSNDDFLDQQDLVNNTPEAQAVQEVVKETQIKQIAQKQAENDNPSSSFSGIECDKSVSCSGDAIQCAIARIQKKQLCLSEFNESEIKQIIDSNPQMSPLGSLADDNLEIDVADLLETEEYVTTDNQCPEPLTYSVLGVEYEIVMTPLCDLASYISFFVLFATWFSMAVILAKSLGTA